MDNQNWLGALQKFQPSSGQGAQSAGNPGMGGGSVPYAPGATQYTPQTARQGPQQAPQSAQVQTPQGAGNMAPGGPQGAPQPQAGQLGDPQRAIAVANYLMARLQRQIALREMSRRG